MEALEKRVDKLESQMGSMCDDMTELRVNNGIFGEILKTTADVQKKLQISIDGFSTTVNKMQVTLQSIQDEISQNSIEIKDVKEALKENEGKGKIDIMETVKKNIISIMLFIYIVLSHVGIIKF